MTRSVKGVLLAAALLVLPATAALAQEEMPPQAGPQGRHCPDNPAGTFRFFETVGQTEQDKSRLETLAGIAKSQRSVCILALTEPQQLQSRRLAVRRVKWVLDILTKNGVPRQIIGIELRPEMADADTMRQVQVIFGK